MNEALNPKLFICWGHVATGDHKGEGRCTSIPSDYYRTRQLVKTYRGIYTLFFISFCFPDSSLFSWFFILVKSHVVFVDVQISVWNLKIYNHNIPHPNHNYKVYVWKSFLDDREMKSNAFSFRYSFYVMVFFCWLISIILLYLFLISL